MTDGRRNIFYLQRLLTFVAEWKMLKEQRMNILSRRRSNHRIQSPYPLLQKFRAMTYLSSKWEGDPLPPPGLEGNAEKPALMKLDQGALHEFYTARQSDAPSLTGFLLACAASLSGRAGPAGATRSSSPLPLPPSRFILWIRQTNLSLEWGYPHSSGLSELGLSPASLILTELRDAPSVLQAGLEGARCQALGAIVIEWSGESKAYDLAASRRLALAAKASGTCLLMARHGAQPRPSAALTRWQIRTKPSRPFITQAPGHPLIELTLLRARNQQAHNQQDGQCHLMEWDRNARTFIDHSPAPQRTLISTLRPAPVAILPYRTQTPRRAASLSGALVSLSANRSDAA